ncbi:MAG: alpha/beta fold hydrolase [Polyangiales bacterium]
MTARAGRRARWAFVALALGALGLLAVAVNTASMEYTARRPPRQAVQRPPTVDELAGLHDVALRTEDGLMLRGWYVPGAGDAAVVLAHPYGVTRMAMLPDARLLAARGFGVLLFDLRAHGESDGDTCTFGDLERRDLTAAVAYVSAREGVKRVGMMGVSFSGPPAALVAAADPRVRALMLKSAVTSIRDLAYDEHHHLHWLNSPVAWLTLSLLGIDVDAVDAHRAVRAYAPRPLLLLHGARDEVVPIARVEALFADAAQPKELVVLAQGDHNRLRDADPSRYDRTVTDFFARTLLSEEK